MSETGWSAIFVIDLTQLKRVTAYRKLQISVLVFNAEYLFVCFAGGAENPASCFIG